MTSIIPGYECDIFISYRQKDNKLDGWVTEFVNTLKNEIEATFKEDITIYFDENPHDGLLETHDVDQSLNEKIKALIFIPIISQTYCDPNCFAWQKEFLPFRDFATNDDFGLNIKLANGNIAKRILPIKIHSIDAEDQTMFEKETDGVMRSIDFIYKSAGVNRPLRSKEEHPEDNLNKTIYRDQINKLANATKDIIGSLKKQNSSSGDGKVTKPNIPAKKESIQDQTSKGKILIGSLMAIIFLVVAYFYYGNRGDTVNDPIETERSIAVLPFTNLSSDPEQEYFSDGMTDQLITNLSKISNLKVIARTSVMQFKGTKKTIPEIARELKVSYVLEGSIQKSGNQVRINAQLIRAQDNFHEWAEVFNSEMNNIFDVQDEVTSQIAKALQIRLSGSEAEKIKTPQPQNTEAFDYFLKGQYLHYHNYLVTLDEESFKQSEEMFKQAIIHDPGYIMAFAGLGDLYDTHYVFKTDNKDLYLSLRDSIADIAYNLDPELGYTNILLILKNLNRPDPDFDSAYEAVKRLYSPDINDPDIYWSLYKFFLDAGMAEIALKYSSKAKELDPHYGVYWNDYAIPLLILGQFKKAEEALNEAIILNPDLFESNINLAWLYLMNGEIDKFKEAVKNTLEFDKNNIPVNLKAVSSILNGEQSNYTLVLNENPILYFYLGQYEVGLDKLDSLYNVGLPTIRRYGQMGSEYGYLQFSNSPLLDPVREDPRMKRIINLEKEEYERKRKRYLDPATIIE